MAIQHLWTPSIVSICAFQDPSVNLVHLLKKGMVSWYKLNLGIFTSDSGILVM